MFIILGTDGKEYGPVAVAKVEEWISGGRANLQTQARRPGETGWRALGDYPEFGAAPPPLAPPPPVGAEPPEVVTLAAAPTPTPSAGPVPPLTGTPAAMTARLAPQAADFDLFSCLSRSFELWKANFLPLVGVTLLVLGVQFVTNLIPFVGFVSSLLLTGVFTGGLYYYYLGKIRGEDREIADAFAGFTKALVPLMLAGLLMNLISFILMGLFFGPLFVAVIQAMMSSTPEPFQFPAMSGAAVAWMLVGTVPLIYLGVAWVMTYMLVVDQGLSAWAALEVSRRVVTRRWFSLFFLLLFAGILGMLGLIGFGIAVIFTLPLTFGAMLYAYEDLCRPRA